MSELPKFVMFSGGHTSGYMLRVLMDTEPNFDKRFKVLFCNTGKEHDSTLEFVHEVETKWSVPIVWLEYTRIAARLIDPSFYIGRRRVNLENQQEEDSDTHWFKIVDFKTAARFRDKDTPFDELLRWMTVVPNVRSRACSGQLKIRTKCRYLHSLNIHEWDDFIGIRKDEEHRKLEILASPEEKGEHSHFPLCDLGKTKQDVDQFWKTNSFKLKIENHEGNCMGCFLKATWKRLLFARNNPELAQWWADKENEKRRLGVSGNGSQFINGKSWDYLIRAAAHPELFNEFDKSEEDIACSCAVGGKRYQGSDE